MFIYQILNLFTNQLQYYFAQLRLFVLLSVKTHTFRNFFFFLS